MRCVIGRDFLAFPSQIMYNHKVFSHNSTALISKPQNRSTITFVIHMSSIAGRETRPLR